MNHVLPRVIFHSCSCDLRVFVLALNADNRFPSCESRSDALRAAASERHEDSTISNNSRRKDEPREVFRERDRLYRRVMVGAWRCCNAFSFASILLSLFIGSANRKFFLELL